MKNRKFVLLLCVAALTCTLTACGNNASGNQDTTTSDSARHDNSGIVYDTDGIIDEQDTNSRSARTDEPVTDRAITDMDNGIRRAGDAVGNGVERVGDAVADGVDDLTGQNARNR